MSDFLVLSQSTLKQAKSIITQDAPKKITVIAGYKVFEIYKLHSFLASNGFPDCTNKVIQGLCIRNFLVKSYNDNYYMPCDQTRASAFVRSLNKMLNRKKAI